MYHSAKKVYQSTPYFSIPKITENKEVLCMATITKRKNSYLIRVSCGYDINGKQIVHSMTWRPDAEMTQRQIDKELQRQAVLFEDKCRSGQYLDGRIKFADFAEIWLKDYGEKQLKATTVDRYTRQLERINQAIGHIQLGKLQPVHLMRFYDNLEEENIRQDIPYIATVDLKQLIHHAGMNRKEFAKLCGVSTNTVTLAYTGKNIQKKSAQKLAAGLNQKLSDIFQPSTEITTLSPNSIRGYHRVISSLLSTAVQWQLIPSNPCQRVRPPKVEKQESRYLDETEALKLLECLSNEPLQYRAMITMLIYSGMRRGEVCGLKWSDIDFEKQLINIQRELMYLKRHGVYEDTPKTQGSRRIIKIANEPLHLLKIHKMEQNLNRLKCGDQWHDNGYIFPRWNGEPMQPDTLSKWFRRFIQKYDLPPICLHSLRHTNASLLIANGVNITTVSKRLGHSDTSVTASVYAHAIKSADEAAADTLQNIFHIK